MDLALARRAADQLAQQGARIDNFQLQAPLEQLPHRQGKAVEPRVAGGTIKASSSASGKSSATGPIATIKNRSCLRTNAA
jgi:hypothetical protein